MTDSDLDALIAEYRAGLEAEIVLLRRLEDVSARQRAASDAQDLATFNQMADDRDRLTAGLAAIEDQLRKVRPALGQFRALARRRPGYDRAVDVHHEAIALVSRILEVDKASLASLASADAARREAMRAVEAGETTLAAYRRVTTLAPGATLVDRRG
jgi:hypothetical protein